MHFYSVHPSFQPDFFLSFSISSATEIIGGRVSNLFITLGGSLNG
ncbi:hypothetical protein FHX08_004297 [Rhizobium sp. BK529]|nr:hypothetical protein [Rhizobium sp. BK529]TCS01351.1 hypothetical protein EV281_10696 [Rhizobium sp. BK418]